MTPVLTSIVAGQPLRLFQPPSDGEFAWASLHDALIAAEYSVEAAAFWADRWCEAYPELFARAEDGTVVAPASAVLGLYEAALDMGWRRASEARSDAVAAILTVFRHHHRGLDEAGYTNALQLAALRALLPPAERGALH